MLSKHLCLILILGFFCGVSANTDYKNYTASGNSCFWKFKQGNDTLRIDLENGCQTQIIKQTKVDMSSDGLVFSCWDGSGWNTVYTTPGPVASNSIVCSTSTPSDVVGRGVWLREHGTPTKGYYDRPEGEVKANQYYYSWKRSVRSFLRGVL